MWKNIIKSLCVLCKENKAKYSMYDENYNDAARNAGHDPEKLCEDCKERLFENQMDAFHGAYD